MTGSAPPARIVVTGADGPWGRRFIVALEGDARVVDVVGLGAGDAPAGITRARYVRTAMDYPSLRDHLAAAAPDAVVHLAVETSSAGRSARRLHETNVIGTMNLLAAAGLPDSSVRHVVLRSSTSVYGSDPHDPALFDEGTVRRGSPPRNSIEASLLETEELLEHFGIEAKTTQVTTLRFADELGPGADNPIARDLARRACPSVMGFDPLMQFVDTCDVIPALVHAVTVRPPGTFNVAGDGPIPWSEVTARCRARRIPLPPLGTGLVAAPLIRLGVLELPAELATLLRYGRGVDTTAYKATGFGFSFDTSDALDRFAAAGRDVGLDGDRPTPRDNVNSDPPIGPTVRRA